MVNWHIRYSTLLISAIILAHSFLSNASEYPRKIELTNSGNERKLRVYCQPVQTQFLVAEPILIVSWLENVGGETEYYTTTDISMSLYSSDGREQKPSMVASVGNQVFQSIERGTGNGPHKSLRPGESTEHAFSDVISAYGKGKLGYFYLPSGKYYLTSSLVNSDTAHFEVVGPRSADDSGAVREFTEFLDAPVRSDDMVLFDSVLQHIVESFPTTRLVPRCLDYLASMAGPSDDFNQWERAQRYARRLLIEYPELPFAKRQVFSLDVKLIPAREVQKIAASLRTIISSKDSPTYLKTQANKFLQTMQ